MRRLVWSIRKRLLSRGGGPRQAERFGARWELDPSDWLDRRLLIGQPFEAAQREWFLGRLSALRPERMYDIGANFGLYAVTASLALPSLEVEAFEPVAATRGKLLRNLALNGLQDRVRVHDLALSDHAGEAEIAIDPRSSGLSTLSASDAEAARREFSTAQTVRLARLDDLAQETGRALAFKIDVEGHEIATLDGMRGVLARNGGMLMIEARERNLLPVREILDEAGWRETGDVEEEHFFEKD